MGKTIIDHDQLIKSIIDKKGIIVGGYVRAWVAAGEPTDEGWNDIDCVFPNLDLAKSAIKNVKNLFGEKAPMIDLRVGHYNKSEAGDINSLTLSFNTFYCCCWKYNGKFATIEPATSNLHIDEMFSLTRNKIAKCILPFKTYQRKSFQIIKMLHYGWKIIDHNNKEIPENILSNYKKRFKYRVTRLFDDGKMIEKRYTFN